VFELADASGVSIIGGDTSISCDSLFIDISVIGECQSGNAVTRRGAKIGDRIYVSGSLGASALGLSLLEDGYRLNDLKDPTDAMRQQAILKHLAPEPQLRLGRAIGEAGLATAMIDISDGLSTDLSHILDESGCGAIIHSGNIPIAACLLTLASETDRLRLALHGGEEYELLFTARPESHREVAELSDTLGTTLTTVGEITEEKGLRLERGAQLEPILPSGFEHII
jgi:thiamine-monophosphate kinase